MKEEDQGIRVLIMTAYGELDMIQEAMNLGALTHFAKPFDIDELVLNDDCFKTFKIIEDDKHIIKAELMVNNQKVILKTVADLISHRLIF